MTRTIVNFKRLTAFLLSITLTWTSLPWYSFAQSESQRAPESVHLIENLAINPSTQVDSAQFALNLNSILTDPSFAGGHSIGDILRQPLGATSSIRIEPHQLNAFVSQKISEAQALPDPGPRLTQIAAAKAVWDMAAAKYHWSAESNSGKLDNLWKGYFDGRRIDGTTGFNPQFAPNIGRQVPRFSRSPFLSISQTLNFSSKSELNVDSHPQISTQKMSTGVSSLSALTQRRAGIALTLSSMINLALGVGYLLLWGSLWHHPMAPWIAVLGISACLRLMAPLVFRSDKQEIEEAGGTLLTHENAPELAGEVESLARKTGIPAPDVYLMPENYGDVANSVAQALFVRGYPRGLLLLSKEAMAHPERHVILAHEIQHLKDAQAKSPWVTLGFSSHTMRIMLMVGGIHLIASSFLLPAAGAFHAFKLLLGCGLILIWSHSAWGLLESMNTSLLEIRGDLGAVRWTGDVQGLITARSKMIHSNLVWKAVTRILNLSGARLGFARVRRSGGRRGSGISADKEPTYYQKAAPDWTKKLSLNPDESFSTPQEYERYKRELDRLRPLARWMAHFYLQLKGDKIERHPNILTIQDVLNWTKHVRKFEATQGWTLKSVVVDGVNKMFEETLPTEPYDGRNLRQEVEAKLRDFNSVLEKLPVPEHLEKLASKSDPTPGQNEPAPQSSEIQERDEEPSLFETKEVEGLDPPDIIVSPTVQKRLEDLLALYSTDYKKKLFPLIIGPTSEGKSSLIKHMFADPILKSHLGRAVPVVSVPVKEAMTRRELLGGLTTEGIELGLLSLAVKYGWVLVLEESDQASGEFKKALNSVVHQIQKQGYFEFELGGKTIRINAHPHFWLVQTQNGEEGNYSFTRNPNAPDYMKRFVVRYYDRLPAPEQAQIMYGLAVKWYGKEFVERQGLTLPFFEQKLVTRFHKPLRELVNAGAMGGDFQEPYEFNRRTLHRFLKRYLYDLSFYESTGRKLDDKTRKLLLARELMEAYGTEVRLPGERQSIWDHMNKVFKLQQKYGIQQKDIEIHVKGMYRNGGKIIVEEELLPIELSIREGGGPRVKGPEYRMTLIPSLAKSMYRAMRNRQFHEHQFSIGPTGVAKTTEQYFLTHLLGEPLFYINMDEQTGSREFHGGFVKDPANGQFRFLAGILARAFMFDPKGLLKPDAYGKRELTPAEVRKSPHIGGTLVIDEASANTIVETINPALDDHIENLSDGQHSAVAGGASHVVLVTNPVGEGYAGYPLTEALRSRLQTVFHPGEWQEDELTEIILDQLTGFTRHELSPEASPKLGIKSQLKTVVAVVVGMLGAGLSAFTAYFGSSSLGFAKTRRSAARKSPLSGENKISETAKREEENTWSLLDQWIRDQLNLDSTPSRMKELKQEASNTLRDDPSLSLHRALAAAYTKVYSLNLETSKDLEDLLATGVGKVVPLPSDTIWQLIDIQGAINATTPAGVFALKDGSWKKVMPIPPIPSFIPAGVPFEFHIALLRGKIYAFGAHFPVGLIYLWNGKSWETKYTSEKHSYMNFIAEMGKKLYFVDWRGIFSSSDGVEWNLGWQELKLQANTKNGVTRWFGTKDELARKKQDLESRGEGAVFENTVHADYIDHWQGKPLVWTERGFYTEENGKWKFIANLPESAPGFPAQAWYMRVIDGVPYVLDDRGMHVVHGNNLRRAASPLPDKSTLDNFGVIPDKFKKSIYLTRLNGNLYATTPRGLYIQEGTKWKRIASPQIQQVIEKNGVLFLNTGRRLAQWSPTGLQPPGHWQETVAKSLGAEISDAQSRRPGGSLGANPFKTSTKEKAILGNNGRTIFSGLQNRKPAPRTTPRRLQGLH